MCGEWQDSDRMAFESAPHQVAASHRRGPARRRYILQGVGSERSMVDPSHAPQALAREDLLVLREVLAPLRP